MTFTMKLGKNRIVDTMDSQNKLPEYFYEIYNREIGRFQFGRLEISLERTNVTMISNDCNSTVKKARF